MQITGYYHLDTNEDQVEALLSEGEYLMLRGRFSEAHTRFEQAIALAPTHAHVFLRQGLSLLDYGSQEKDEKSLILASQAFKKAHQIEPDSFATLHNWASALSQVGQIKNIPHFFAQAKEKYEKALPLASSQESSISADIHWEYGVNWMHIATHSEEACDWQCALQAYEKAAAHMHPMPADFWVDCGIASLAVAEKINDIRQVVKAINCLKYATTQEPSSLRAHTTLADALEKLYWYTHDEEHFALANDCYTSALKLAPEQAELWLKWASLLCMSGRKMRDVKKVRSAIEKCGLAQIHEPQNPLVLSLWGEALALLGELTERIELLYEGQNKIEDALEIAEDNPEVWYSSGMCLHSCALYFNDFDFYYQAIEKFQTGLSINRSLPKLWYAIATSYAAVGNLENDIEATERSIKFYQKAAAFNPCNSYLAIEYAFALAKLGEMLHNQEWLELALQQFEYTLNLQKNAVYLHPDWLFHYACTLDLIGDFHEDESYYTKAIEILSHVLMIDPDFPRLHHRLAQTFCHLGELMGEVDHFYRSIHHLRLALKHEDEDDQMILDWGIVLINIAQHAPPLVDIDQLYKEAEQKMTLAAKLGNAQAFYQLSCLYSLTYQYEKSFQFLMKADSFKALPPLEELLQDEWLDGLRTTTDFRAFVYALENRSNR